MDMDELQVDKSYYDALCEDEHTEMEFSPGDSTFPRHWS